MAENADSKAEKDEGKSQGSKENTLTFVASECAVDKVTVYPDRAEVCRCVEAELVSGQNQVIIKKLPDMVDPTSVRVEGRGEATILEVVFQSEAVPKGEEDMSAREKEIEEEREALMKEKRIVESQLDVLHKQWKLLDSFATSASKAGSGTEEGHGPALGARELNDSFFQGLTKFLQMYSQEGNSLEQKRLELEALQETVNAKLNANAENWRKLRQAQNSINEIKKCVIVVDCQKSSKVLLLVSYVTSSASWSPSYDIRMYTSENKLKFTYYGQIQQSTGEDWLDAKLFLSTAMPSIGGDVPQLMTAQLQVRRYSTKRQNRASQRLMSHGLSDEPEPMKLKCMSGVDEDMAVYASPIPSLSHAETKVGEGVATTMYEIARRSTIPSDNVEHKVTVGLVDVQPKISYISVPQRVPHAFMLATVTNSSPYTFLAGETSIFLDNTFVGKASVKDVYPMEEFECSLGVDPAVKITYKPQKKYRSSSGIISKNVTFTHEQVIEVKNTHDYGINIKVTDQLPRSGDDRIKVNLLEPQIDVKQPEKSKDKGVILNKSNNLEWTHNLKAVEEKEITLRYTVEHPARETIYTTECYENTA